MENLYKEHLMLRILRVIVGSGGEGMKRTELVRKLKKGGFVVTSGSPHGKAYHPSNPKRTIPIPHGSTIKDRTAERILRDAGLN